MTIPGRYERLSSYTSEVQSGQYSIWGELETGGYGVWLSTGGSPMQIYPPGEGGRFAAWAHWNAWEHPPATYMVEASTPTVQYVERSSSRLAWWVAFIAVIAVGYLLAHDYWWYHRCAVQPGLFSWPETSCR